MSLLRSWAAFLAGSYRHAAPTAINGGGEANPAARSKPADKGDDDDDIEKQAEKLLKDALKNLPKGL